MRLYEYLITVKGYAPDEAASCVFAYDNNMVINDKWYSDIMDYSMYDENEAYFRWISYYKD